MPVRDRSPAGTAAQQPAEHPQRPPGHAPGTTQGTDSPSHFASTHANADQRLMIPLPHALALLGLSSFSACAFHNTATHWNGHLGADGQPVFVRTSSYVGMNFAILVPMAGRTTVDEMIEEATRAIDTEHGSHLRLVETETNNYWYGIPPLSWLFSPVVTSISFEYRPSPKALAEAAAADERRSKRRAAADQPATPVPSR